MVLDAKALTWAAKNEIDTAKLKKARIPIYGKWYFPEIPPNVPLINLETGEQQVFPERMIAGEVIFVPAADLQVAGLAPAVGVEAKDAAGPAMHTRAVAAVGGDQHRAVDCRQPLRVVAVVELGRPEAAPDRRLVGHRGDALGGIARPHAADVLGQHPRRW